jgi:ATP-dependent DNA helicase RecG
MLFEYNPTAFQAIIAKQLTPSQRAFVAKQGLATPNDFLLCQPKRYDVRQYRMAASQLQVGVSYALIGQLRHIQSRNIRRNLTVYNGMLHTGSGEIPIVWFNQKYIVDRLANDPYVVAYGKWDATKLSMAFNMAQCDICYRFEDTGDGTIMPYYADIKGVSNKKLTSIIKLLLQTANENLLDMLPDAVRRAEGLVTAMQALNDCHFPKNQAQVAQAQQRFAFDELFMYLYPRRERHLSTKVSYTGVCLSNSHHLCTQYVNQLPYTLTGAQERVWTNIQQTLTDNKLVFQLIQGDVGSGKTDIAILSLLAAVGAGYKGALLVPTEILAQQHFYKCQERCQALGVTIVLLKGKMKVSERKAAIAQLSGPEPLIVVGTHAIIQDTISISQLGFVVIDEQHRFGVFQRQVLLDKSVDASSTKETPHCLFMTATPIPRTLMLTHYGDLAHDVIDEMPPGRVPIKTYYGKTHRMQQIMEFIRLEIKKGCQAYIVYPLIEASEHLDLACAMEGYEQVCHEFSDHGVGLLHGKMKPDNKKDIMDKFKQGEVHILVSTTVIEVGVDVPNATVMVIMNAERFGLSQLHQLRGRVGRGTVQGHCFLVADAKSVESRQRIKAMVASTNGFALAEEDLKIRGPGNLLGTQQSGDMVFSFANIMDQAVVQRVVAQCDAILSQKDAYKACCDFMDRATQQMALNQLN